MPPLAVIAAVLNRPDRVAPLAASLAASQPELIQLVLVCSPGDTDEITAAREANLVTIVVEWEPGPGDYARKNNHAFRFLAGEGFEWMLLGADDLHFHPGWAATALTVAERSDACVVGTNDYGNPTVTRGRHATHSLVHRDYLECGTIDEDGKILCELYDHNFVDNELVETAKARGTFAFAADSVVEHLHPNWRKGEWDDTYTKGQRAFEADRHLFRRRQRLWRGVGR